MKDPKKKFEDFNAYDPLEAGNVFSRKQRDHIVKILVKHAKAGHEVKRGLLKRPRKPIL